MNHKAQIITIAATKGGTGKTASAAALSQAAAHNWERVLCIDLDPQCNLSFWNKASFNRPGVFSLFSGEDPHGAVQPSFPNMDIIAGSGNMIAVKTSPGSARRLENVLEAFREEYDWIIIDTPPATGEILNNALFAADRVLVPLEADANGIQSLYEMGDILSHTRDIKPEVEPLGTILTRYDKRPLVNRNIKDAIEAVSSQIGIPFLGVIRQGVAMREAAAMMESLYDYAPRSKPAQDYYELYQRIRNIS